MKKYCITSHLYEGEIMITYNDNGMLLDCNFNNSTLTERQQSWILRHLPLRQDKLHTLFDKEPLLILQEMDITVSFDDFWNRYDDKLNSSKRRCLVKWNRMSKAEQVRAYNYITCYFSNLPSGVRKKYAETYLNAELWNNLRKYD